MITTRKLHVLLSIVLILNACGMHRTTSHQASSHLADSLRLDRHDSLSTNALRLWQSARSLRLTEFALSPPDSLGRQHLTHVRLAHAEAVASDSLALHRRYTTSATETRRSTSSIQASKQTDTRADALRMPGWEWAAACLLLLIILICVKKQFYL